MSRTRVPYPSAQPVYEAAVRWRHRCLLDDRSLFADRVGSTLADAETLIRDFVEQPDHGDDNFLTKLSRQLARSPASAVQLAAELLYVHLLIARSDAVSGGRKREIVNKVLSFNEGTSPLPDDLAAALESGLVRPGQAFNSYRWRQFAYLIELFAALKRLPAHERRETLHEPERFLALVDNVPEQGANTQRHAIEHLLFPDTFPSVVSQEQRVKVLEHWRQPAGFDEPEAMRLSLLVQRLSDDPNDFVNLYRSPYWWQWSEPTPQWQVFGQWAARLLDSVDVGREERDYKQAAYQRLRDAKAASEAGDPNWPRLLATAVTKDNNLIGWRVQAPFLQWVAAEPESAGAALRQLWTEPGWRAIDRFLARVPATAAEGTGARLSIASFLLGAADEKRYPPWRAQATDRAYRLTSFGKPEPTATDGERYHVFLDFLDLVGEISARHKQPLQDRLDAQGLVWALINYEPPGAWSQPDREAFTAWRAGKGTAPIDGPRPPQPGPDPGTERTLGELAQSLHLDQPFLDEIVDLLDDKQQVIFYGPPGTGKTYIARGLAAWIAGDPGRVRLVQFHPSYAYEDFVEGLRPREGEAGFWLVDGPLVEMARAADADRANRYVLVVDEMNRGNVARVFGELYFLLEYRNQPARLLYSRSDFSLPDNLLIIGTMNTADRSIALLDTALRRRFYFVSFRPDEAPVSQVLDRYLAQRHPDLRWVADVVRRANTQLGDPDAAIGPSHFMRDNLDERWVRRAWENSVLPTLEEHFYGQPGRLAEFDLDRLRLEVDAPGDDAQLS